MKAISPVFFNILCDGNLYYEKCLPITVEFRIKSLDALSKLCEFAERTSAMELVLFPVFDGFPGVSASKKTCGYSF